MNWSAREIHHAIKSQRVEMQIWPLFCWHFLRLVGARERAIVPFELVIPERRISHWSPSASKIDFYFVEWSHRPEQHDNKEEKATESMAAEHKFIKPSSNKYKKKRYINRIGNRKSLLSKWNEVHNWDSLHGIQSTVDAKTKQKMAKNNRETPEKKNRKKINKRLQNTVASGRAKYWA